MVRSASCSMGRRTPIAKNFYSEVNEPRYCSEPWELGVHTFIHTHTQRHHVAEAEQTLHLSHRLPSQVGGGDTNPETLSFHPSFYRFHTYIVTLASLLRPHTSSLAISGCICSSA